MPPAARVREIQVRAGPVRIRAQINATRNAAKAEISNQYRTGILTKGNITGSLFISSQAVQVRFESDCADRVLIAPVSTTEPLIGYRNNPQANGQRMNS